VLNEAKGHIEAALGVAAPFSSPSLYFSVEDRLQQERKEPEEKVRAVGKRGQG
jgi:hypothetical protein